MSLSLFTALFSVVSLGLLVALMLQMRSQQQATATMISDNRVRTQLLQDADESTSFILSRTIQNISSGHPDSNLESDSFTLKVVRELVKRKLSKDKWLETQNNERLVHELYLLLRNEGSRVAHDYKKDPPNPRVNA
jgi:hypothetical protein